MTAKERAPLGFGDELDNFDPAAWAKAKASRPVTNRSRQW